MTLKLDLALQTVGLRDLRSFTEAWGVDVVKRDDPAEYADKVLANRTELLNHAAVEKHLQLSDLPYRVHMLTKAQLRRLLNERDYSCEVDAFHGMFLQEEQQFLEWATKPTALRHLDPKVRDIYATVLEAAWEDNVNASEYRLLERLRAKLGITRRDHRIIELQLGKYPSATGGGTHTVAEIEDGMRHLLKRGLVLRVQTKTGARSYCIAEEIASLLREILAIELTAPVYLNLLNQLPVTVLRSALEAAGQPFTGARDFLAARLVDGYVSPKAVLRQVSDDQMEKLLKVLPTVRQDGTKEIRVRNVVRYFDSLDLLAPDLAVDRSETYVSYFTELAKRSYEVLRAAKVIAKDRDVERHFEDATTTLFRDYLGYTVEAMDGSNHPDGRVTLDDPHRVILWDCKSCESEYSLTDRLARQFLGYAHAAAPMVASPLVVVAPAFSSDAVSCAVRLKVQCPPGTEIALLAAEDLLWLARMWRQRRTSKEAGRLPWQVLATTGLLSRDHLEQRLRAFVP
jgi:hypothetical protein